MCMLGNGGRAVHDLLGNGGPCMTPNLFFNLYHESEEEKNWPGGYIVGRLFWRQES